MKQAAQRTVSFKALQRARPTIEDFAKSYFPYLGLRLPDDFLTYLDVLVWVEATIYQLDEDNESLTECGRLDQALVAEGIQGITEVLRQQGLLDEQLQRELKQGLRYWSLEQDICRRLLAAPRALQAPAALTAEEVLECHAAKSFDYRVLCLLLFRLARLPHDEALLSFLRLDEMLVDISDDLVDYEDDVLANSFNIFRCYIQLYGKEAELKLVERISSLEGQHGRLLAGLSEGAREHYWRRHREASEGQGSDRWVFPPPIYDEAAYRVRVRSEEAAAAAATGAAGEAAAAVTAAALGATEAVGASTTEAEAPATAEGSTGGASGPVAAES
ncbi:hypothetical protein PLESTF_001616300 [Pleodorina starrii]|nr:hypothetical protein PLESTM_001500200 [Pleodorina starrii]GLC75274.1 hypothetical protein PLESTF_001616300 [Pleodorina starrii]